jgi:hypothetical protein
MQKILGKLLVSSTHSLHQLKKGAQISSRRHLIVRFPHSLFLIIVIVFKKSRAWDESPTLPKLLLKLSIEMQKHSYSTLLRNISWPLKFLGARISLKRRHKHNCVVFLFQHSSAHENVGWKISRNLVMSHLHDTESKIPTN